MKSLLVGAGAGMALAALGLDTSVSLSTYGLYLGGYGPFLVISGIPIFLDLVFAFLLLKADQKVIRYSMIASGVVMSLIVGFLAFVGIFQVLIPGS